MVPGAASEQLVEIESLGEGVPRFAVAPVPDDKGFHEKVEDFKRWLIEDSLRQTGGNRTEAAKHLGIHRTYLMKLIRDFGVSMPLARRRARRRRIKKSTEALLPAVAESIVTESSVTELPHAIAAESPEPMVTELLTPVVVESPPPEPPHQVLLALPP
ncbi:MAG TPA: helix-turn-helix domain-containing protein [Methylomirabilota bacterium]|nr:helix-turn-helix domain-containing protein [Methylomirabilota bacterium]